MVEQPSGTVTLVFTDVEGSTRLLGELGREGYLRALAEHRRILREAFGSHAGYEVDYEGDAFFYAFPSASAAVVAVEEAMRALEGGPIRLRVGMHTGEPGLDPPKYVGLDVHLAARVMAAAHGGQVLLTRATRELIGADSCELGRHRLRDIPEPVWLYQLGVGDFPPPRTLGRLSLPAPATGFVGRKRELRGLLALLRRRDVRLVTLTGPGGTGKTRLALELGRRLEHEREVLFLDLAPATNEREVLAALAAALDVRERTERSLVDAVSTAMSARSNLLLLLDNCEQVAVPLAGIVEALLAETRDGRILATSREPLHVDAEYRVVLAPLQVPAAGDPHPERSEAVRLFLDRLRRVAPRFVADEATTAAAAALVRGLDGLPLAIELAAARAALLGVAEVRDRLGERFRVLQAAGPRAAGRHRSLEHALEWSYQLLGVGARAAFGRLSVFPGSFSLAAAEAVVGPDALELIPTLADASLLALEDAEGGAYRYRLLETIRAYAGAKLHESGESTDAHRRLTEWSAATAQAAATSFDTANEKEGLSTLDREGETCAAALEWALTGEPATALRLALALSGWRRRRGRYRENDAALSAALHADPRPEPAIRARALLERSRNLATLGDLGGAERLAGEAASLFRELHDPRATVQALVVAATCQRYAARLDDAAATATEALSLARQHDDNSGAVESLVAYGFARVYASDYGEGYRCAREALEIAADDLSPEARTARVQLLADAAFFLDLEEAGSACELGRGDTTDERAAFWFTCLLGAVRWKQGRRTEAAELTRESLEFSLRVDERIVGSNALVCFAEWAASSGRAETAARLMGAHERFTPHRRSLPFSTDYTEELVHAETRLGRGAFATAVAAGKKLEARELLALVQEFERELRSGRLDDTVKQSSTATGSSAASV